MTETYEKGTVQSQRVDLELKKENITEFAVGIGSSRRQRNILAVKDRIERGIYKNQIWEECMMYLTEHKFDEYYLIAQRMIMLEKNNGTK